MIESLASVLPASTDAPDGNVRIGGVVLADLAHEFGTPLVVYDAAEIDARANAYLDGLASYTGESSVVYASKAWTSLWMLAHAAKLGLGADVASMGELAFASQAGMPAGRLVVHGNNKSVAEILEAVRGDSGLIVLDAPDEWELVAAAARSMHKVQRVLVRVNPSVDVDTHDYVKTGHDESKFGMSPEAARATFSAVRETEHLELAGVHIHLGSQLLSAREWEPAVVWLAGWAAQLHAEGIELPVVDVGGGLGIAYTEQTVAPSIAQLVREIATLVEREFMRVGLVAPHLILEPGRSIVGPAGVTIYEVGSIKQAGGVTWAAVDGGMSDNIRPALYGAEYRAIHVTRANEPPTDTYRIAGKHCESGDVLVDTAPLPRLTRGDLIAVAATGAYGLSMSSNYNSLGRPAVAVIEDGEARLIVRREDWTDLMRREQQTMEQPGATVAARDLQA